MKPNFLDWFLKNTLISNFTKICPVESELFYTERRTDKHDETNSRFSQFLESAEKVTLNKQKKA